MAPRGRKTHPRTPEEVEAYYSTMKELTDLGVKRRELNAKADVYRWEIADLFEKIATLRKKAEAEEGKVAVELAALDKRITEICSADWVARKFIGSPMVGELTGMTRERALRKYFKEGE